MQTERRRSPRMTVEGIGFITLHLKDAYEIMGTLEGLSRNGLHLTLLPTGPEAEPAPGDPVALGELPKGLDALLGGLGGHVVWTDGLRCGVAIDPPLEVADATLEQALRDNHLLPWSQWGH